MNSRVRFYWIFRFETGMFFRGISPSKSKQASRLRKTPDMFKAKQFAVIDPNMLRRGHWLKENVELEIRTFEEVN